MSDTSTPRVRYNVGDTCLYLTVAGSACHQTSLVGEHLATEFLAQNPPEPTLVLDLDACGFLDSTFAGWMIRLYRRLKAVGGRLVVSRCAGRCRADLEMMELTSLFDFEDAPPDGGARSAVDGPSAKTASGPVARQYESRQRAELKHSGKQELDQRLAQLSLVHPVRQARDDEKKYQRL